MKKTIMATAVIAIVAIIGLFLFIKITSGKDKGKNFAEVKKGYFEISISATGELIAENSTDVKGPNIVQNRNFRATPLRITDIIPEGTTVKKGDYIATLDRSAFNNTLKDEQDGLKTDKNELDMKVLDTAVTMSTMRDDIRNQYFTTEEAEVTLAQSKFEPPATQRQAAIENEKSQRTLMQKQKLYSLKKEQTKAEIRNLKIKVSTRQRRVNDLDSILRAFVITAPSDGMVIYKKDPAGQKIKLGSTLNPWDPVVATLPDLSSLLSKVYISEIDIKKIIPGQTVEIGIDAFKDKNFTGSIYSIANIGEQLANSDSKVFEVLVKINDSDPLLRPSMTTSNKVIIKTFNDVVFVPNESVYAGVDSITYVFTKNGKKQIVIPGEANDKNIIIEAGLEPGTSVWLSIPENQNKFTLSGKELISEIKKREVAEIAR